MTGGSSEHGDTSDGAPVVGAAQEAEEAVERDLDAVLDTARRERDEYLDMLRRVQADFENYKKRMVRQQTDLLERAAEGLVGKLLPVLDAFDLARAHLEAEGSPEGKALLQAAGLLSDTLAKEGLERVDERGVEFDPTSQEAVEHLPADADAAAAAGDGAPGGPVVVDVLRAGYRYKGRVIRPAMVRVQG
ncbi:MAG: nucleotide exchange factor GrpE [Acidobacteriota bacterium]|nr:nucleotide exchange factor GrpE [Acidobacteriota bacterium]